MHAQKVTNQPWEKGAWQLIKIVKNFDFVIINKEKDVCKEKCTRVQGQVRSILDYVLTNKLLSTAIEMIIDENNQYGLFGLEKQVGKHTQTPMKYY